MFFIINRLVFMEIWAHRGRISPKQPGNSVSNFMTCYRLAAKGLCGFETDVTYTADKKAIIYHPGSTQPDLAKMTWNEIRGSIFDVLPVSSFLRSLRSYSKMPCCLDIKQNSEELVTEVVDMVARERLQERIFITTFQKKLSIPPFIRTETGGELLLLAKKLDPAIKTHLIATFPFDLIAIANKYQPDAISFGWLPENRISKIFFKLLVVQTRDLKQQIEWLRNVPIEPTPSDNAGIKIWAGIVNTAEEMEYFAKLGVDGIMTDNAELGISFKESWNSND